MSVGVIAAFGAVSFLFIVTPGADWAYAITAGLRHRSVLPAVGGLLVGHVVATVVVAGGVAGFLAGSPVAMTALTVAGAAYLVWLGIATVIHPPVPTTGHQTQAPVSTLRQAATGAGISGLNPKVFLLFLALMPQFTDPSGSWPLATQIVLLGLIHVAGCAVVYTAVGTGARRVLRARPTAATIVSRASGTIMVLVGLTLVAEQLSG